MHTFNKQMKSKYHNCWNISNFEPGFYDILVIPIIGAVEGTSISIENPPEAPWKMLPNGLHIAQLSDFNKEVALHQDNTST